MCAYDFGVFSFVVVTTFRFCGLLETARYTFEMLPMEEFRPTPVLLFVAEPREKKLLTCYLWLVCVAFRDDPLLAELLPTYLLLVKGWRIRLSREAGLCVPKP